MKVLFFVLFAWIGLTGQAIDFFRPCELILRNAGHAIIGIHPQPGAPKIYLLDLNNSLIVRNFESSSPPIAEIKLEDGHATYEHTVLGDGRVVLFQGNPQSVKIWNPETDSLMTVHSPTPEARELPNGNLLFGASMNSGQPLNLRLVDPKTGKLLTKLKAASKKAPYEHWAILTGGQVTVTKRTYNYSTNTFKNKLILLNPETLAIESQTAISVANGIIRHFKALPGGKIGAIIYNLASRQDEFVKIDPTGEESTRRLPIGPYTYLDVVEFLPNGKIFFGPQGASRVRGPLRLLDTETLAFGNLCTVKGTDYVTASAFARIDGAEVILFATFEGNIAVLDANSLEPLAAQSLPDRQWLSVKHLRDRDFILTDSAGYLWRYRFQLGRF